MQYIIRAYDGENMLDKRMEVRPSHIFWKKTGRKYMSSL